MGQRQKKDLFRVGATFGTIKVLDVLRGDVRRVSYDGGIALYGIKSLRNMINEVASDLVSLPDTQHCSPVSNEMLGQRVITEFGMRRVAEGTILARFEMSFTREAVTYVRQAMASIGWTRDTT